MNKYSKTAKRKRRHFRIRKRLIGTTTVPRLCVFRSSKNIYAQLIDDTNGTTIVAASTLDKDFQGIGSNKEAARIIGRTIAKKALDKSINKVVFDRNGYLYHGRISELAEGAREAGLQF